MLGRSTKSRSCRGILSLFNVRRLLPGGLVFLSDNRLEGFLVIHALLGRPHILVLSGPFVKLSTPSENILIRVLRRVAGLGYIRIILLLSGPSSVPRVVARILPIGRHGYLPICDQRRFLGRASLVTSLFPFRKGRSSIQDKTFSLPIKRRGRPSTRLIAFEVRRISVGCNGHAVLGSLS